MKTWDTKITEPTEYFKMKYSEPATVVIPKWIMVDGTGLTVIERDIVRTLT